MLTSLDDILVISHRTIRNMDNQSMKNHVKANPRMVRNMVYQSNIWEKRLVCTYCWKIPGVSQNRYWVCMTKNLIPFKILRACWL